MKLGYIEITEDVLRNSIGDGTAAGLCQYINKHYPKLSEHVVQFIPTLRCESKGWTVIYRWED